MSSRVSVLRGQNTMPLQAMLDRPVAFHREFVGLGIGVTGALMLSQALYWSSRTNDKEGWFYKSQSEWESETGLTRREQDTARKKLKAMGFFEEDKKGVPCRVFFRVNLEKVQAELDAQKRQSSMAESAKLDCTKAPNCDGGKRQTITEITTETTSSSAQGAHVIELFAGSEFRPMTLDWEPDQKTLKAYALAQGVNLSLITKELIAGFSCHFSAHPETCDTAAGWNNRLVKWAKSEKVRVEADSAAVDESEVPVDKIIDLYHRTCPNLARVSVTTDRNLRARIVERWNESEAQQNSGFWKGFFLKANLRNEVFYGGERVKPRLEALVSRSVFRAIVEAEQ